MRDLLTSKRAGWALVILGVLLLAVWAVTMGSRALSLRRHLTQIESWAEAPETVDPAAACELVASARADVTGLHRGAGGLVRLAPALGWLPRVGGDLRAAPHLLAMADGLTEVGAIGCEVAGPLLGFAHGAGDSAVRSLVAALEDGRVDLDQARGAAVRAERAWQQVDVDDLSPRLAKRAPLLDRALPLMRGALSAAAVAPDLLGANGTRTYLVLALNEDELRPGGGFISGVGEVHLDAGQGITMTFRDSYAVDDFSEPYPDAPEPMERYMGLELWVFRDSNWSADFPTAARQAIELYRPGYPISIDGVVALDQIAVQELVRTMDPLTVEGTEDPVTGDTVLGYMQESWEPGREDWTREWWSERKSFMGAIAEAAWSRVEERQVNWASLGRSLLQLLEQKNLQMYVADPIIAQMLDEQGWDGALRPGDGDFLMVVDANLGYNKATAKLQQEAVYEVDLAEVPPRATLTLTYTHTSTADVECKPEASYTPTYEGMTERCYWGYLRVLVPQASELLAATSIPVPGHMLWSGEDHPGEVEARSVEEAAVVSWEVITVLAPRSVQARGLEWTLPSDIVEWDGTQGRYVLTVPKQPGKQAHPVTVRLGLPQGTALMSGSNEPYSVEGRWVTYRLVLDRDLEIDVTFGRGR